MLHSSHSHSVQEELAQQRVTQDEDDEHAEHALCLIARAGKETGEFPREVDTSEISENCPEAVTGLHRLGRSAIVTKKALAEMFGLHPASVDRSIQRGELPPPVKVLGKSRWTVGVLVDFIEEKLHTAQRMEEDERKRLAKYAG